MFTRCAYASAKRHKSFRHFIQCISLPYDVDDDAKYTLHKYDINNKYHCSINTASSPILIASCIPTLILFYPEKIEEQSKMRIYRLSLNEMCVAMNERM